VVTSQHPRAAAVPLCGPRAGRCERRRSVHRRRPPDTQYYTTANDLNELYFKGQTNWIVNNRQDLNLAFVLHVGDIQNNGNPYYADGTPTPWLNGNESQWVRADASLDILDNNNIPYSLVPGNHDYLHFDMKTEPGYYLKWFGPQRFASKPTFGGASPITPTSPAGMNTYHIFEAGGYRFLNLALQYDPDVHDLKWAQQVINENPGLPTILSTHQFIQIGGYQSPDIFNKLIKLNPQVVMSVNGHRNGAYLKTDTNIAGKQVHQMLVDYQNIEYPPYFMGGGYLRTMQFDTDANVVNIKTYSPVIGNYQTDPANQFSIPLNLRDRFGLPNAGGIKRNASFRDGVDGYGGTVDTYVDADVPTTSFGGGAIAWVDGDLAATSGAQPTHSLIRFDQILSADAIPLGATIDDATLTLHTNTATNSQSNSTMSLYRLLRAWDENSTWSSLIGGISADALEAILAANGAVVPNAQGGTVSFDVTESLAAWAAGAPNFGWVLLPGGTDGWRWDTSEAINLLDRPLLDVGFTVVPEPAAAMMIVVASGLALFRRRHGP
jgi:hypothetical protein